MMKKRTQKLLSLILVIFLCLPILASCGDTQKETEPLGKESGSTTPPEVTEPETEPEEKELLWPSLVDKKRQKYMIVIPESTPFTELIAAIEMKSILTAVSSVYFTYETDLVTWQGIPDRYEIVIGNTNREETAAAKLQLSDSNPYVVTEIGKRIVITAINNENLVEAVHEFLMDYAGMSAENLDFVPDQDPSTAKPVMPETPITPATPSISLPDQTGHPEVQGDHVDVEDLLKVDPDYDYTNDYKVGFNGVAGNGTTSAEIKVGLIKSEYDTLYDIVADVNVLSYGAVGDGVHDDTAAFKAAINAVYAMGGGTVYVPKGYYCLTETLRLPGLVTLAGELKEGTAEGTVLCIYGGKGTTDYTKGAILCDTHSSVQNLAFWYPEQTIVNGQAIPYPASIVQTQICGPTVRNVTFVNSYRGIDASNGMLSIQYNRDIYGTCLDYAFHNDNNLDIGRLENFVLSPNFWLESGLPGTPNEELLRTYMIRNSIGIKMGQADFFYFADVKIDGYKMGFYFYARTAGSGENLVACGQMLNPMILDCYYPIYVSDTSWFKITGGELRAFGNEGAAAVFYEPTAGKKTGAHQPASLYFVNTDLSSSGRSAIINQSGLPVNGFYGCSLSSGEGSTLLALSPARYNLINTTVSGGNGKNYDIYNDESFEMLDEFDLSDYEKVTKPYSDNFVIVTEAPFNAKEGEDISIALQAAIDSLKETGGMVYIPAGVYYLNSHINIWEGVEVRGSTMSAHVDMFLHPATNGKTENGTNPYQEAGTVLYTNFGKNDPDGMELISMYKSSGLTGLSIEYFEQEGSDIRPYSFTVRGYGSDIYIIEVGMSTSWRCVDFATNRCDNHYIEFLYNVGLDIAIQVGAESENGIIRDCFLTVNCWQLDRYSNPSYWDDAAVHARKATGYIIGESKNQVLYNCFAINKGVGIEVRDGAENFFSVGTAIDHSDVNLLVSGNATVNLVNGQFVSIETINKYVSGVATTDDFTGKVNVYNTEIWGYPKYIFSHNGSGELNAILCVAGSWSQEFYASVTNGTANFIGCIGTRSAVTFTGSNQVKSLHIIRCKGLGSVNVDATIPSDVVTIAKKED